MAKIQFQPATRTDFALELEQLVRGTGLTQQAFMDEVSLQLEEALTLSRFNSWIRGRYVPPITVQERVLSAARSVAAEAARYPKPPKDIPIQEVQEKLAGWQKHLTLKQVSVITGLPFITLNSWRVGKHRQVRYAKWQQAVKLMDLWLVHTAEIQTTMQEAKTIMRKRRTIPTEARDSVPSSENRIAGILSLSRSAASPSTGKA